MMTDDIRPLDRLRCNARVSSGVLSYQCSRYAQDGGLYCYQHSPYSAARLKHKREMLVVLAEHGITTAEQLRERLAESAIERWCGNCGREPIDEGQIECAACTQWFADNPLPDTITVSVDEWDALHGRVSRLAEALRDARTAIERANGMYLMPGYPDQPGGLVFLDHRGLLARLDALFAEPVHD